MGRLNRWLSYFDPSLTVILVIAIFSMYNTRWSDFTQISDNGPKESPVIRAQKIANEVDTLSIDDKVKVKVTIEILKYKVNNAWKSLQK